MNHTVYELLCPNLKAEYPENVRYVGYSKDSAYARLATHIGTCFKIRNTQIDIDKNTWLQNLLMEGKVPIVNILSVSTTKKEALLLEKQRIAALVSFNNLLNVMSNPDKQKYHKQKIMHYIYDIHLNIVFSSDIITECAKFLGISTRQVHNSKSGKTFTQSGYIVSTNDKLISSDINLHSFNSHVFRIWDCNNLEIVNTFSSSKEAIAAVGAAYTSFYKALNNKKALNGYFITRGDDKIEKEQIIPKFKVTKNGVQIDVFNFNELIKIVNFPTWKLYDLFKQNGPKITVNDFYIDKQY